MTDKIEEKPKPSPKAEKKAGENAIESVDPNATVALKNSIYDDNATVPLKNQEQGEQTDILSDGTELLADNETTVLNGDTPQPSVTKNVKTDGFEVIKSIVLIHTNETI